MSGWIAAVTALLCAIIAAPAVAGTPAKAGPPSAMASLGDSITRGFNTCPWSAPYGDCVERSWSTGDGSITSQYQRILAFHSPISGRNYNNGRTGAKIGEMVTQAAAAGAHSIKPELVTVLLGANDACTSTEAGMTSVAAYRQRLEEGLRQISASLPDARIYVLSVPNIYQLWQLGRGTALESTIWNTANICQSMLANPGSTAAADQQRRERVRQRVMDYNAQIADVCGQLAHCRHDAGRVFGTAFNLDQVSNLDGFHPNEEGQKKLAEVAWQGQFDYADRTAPAAPALIAAREPDGADGWYRAPVAVRSTTSAADAKGSEYALRSGTPAGNPTSWSPWPGTAVNVAGAGRNELQVRTVDTAGNISASATLVVKVDEVAPELTLTAPAATGADGWHLTRPAIAVAPADPDGSGIDTTTCTANGTEVPVVAGKVTPPADGTIDVRCVAADKAGNTTARTVRVKVDTASPTVALTQAPDGRDGWWRGDATVAYEVDDASPVTVSCVLLGSSVAVRPVAGSDGRRGELTAKQGGELTCTATDVAGRIGHGSATLKIDRTAPQLALAATPDGTNGFFRTTPAPVGVTVTGAVEVACTADETALTVAQPPSTALFTTTTGVAGDGTHAVACTATDAAGNTTSDTRTVKTDATAPQVTIAQTPDGDDGWWTGPAQASASVEDVHPDALACTVDGSAVEDPAAIAITGDGTHEVACTATDRAGNTGTDTATVKIDAEAPELALSTAPDGRNGFFRTAPAPVAVAAAGETALACTVDGADVTDPAALTVAGEGSHAVSCTARDAAGNATTRTATVEIDTTAPQVAIDQAPDGRAGWWRGTATATATVTDTHANAVRCTVDGSPAGEAGDAPAPAVTRTVTVTGDGEHAVRCEGEDAAGNTATQDATVKIDATAPGLALASTPDGDAGWFRSSTARVDVTSADASAEVACTVGGAAAARDEQGRVAVTGDGVREVRCTATDPAGNPTAATHTVKIDTKAPAAPTASVDRAPEALGWHRDQVTVTWAAAGDPGTDASGVDPSAVPAARKVTADGVSELTATVRDRAGNVSAPATYAVRVDSVAPAAALTCPTGALAKDAVATAAVTASDAASGVVDVPALLTLDTSSGGEKQAQLTVRDRVGHETQATCAYRVDAQEQPPAPVVSPPVTVAASPQTSSSSTRAGANGVAGGTSGTAGATRPGLQRLTLTFTPKTAKKGRRLRVTVKLTPAPSTRPRVAIERRVKGKWRRVKVVRLGKDGRATTTVTSIGGDKLRARLLT